jgi:hypothetical protein
MLSTVHHLSMPSSARRAGIFCLARLRRLVNGWVAAAIARHERRVALALRGQPDARELRAIGLYRGPIDGIIERASRSLWRRLQLFRRHRPTSMQAPTAHGRRR